MQKKVIVISFIIVVLIWVGYMVSRHLGQSGERAKTNNETYQDLIRIAKKSPNGGLIHVAIRLNKYKAEKGGYPERLIDLYPEYVPSEEYITGIQWDYERKGNNDFTLAKTIAVDGVQQTAMIGKGLRITSVSSTRPTEVAEITDERTQEGEGAPSEEELGVMVASPATASTSGEETPEEAEETEAAGTEPAESAEATFGPMIATAPEIVTVVKEEIAPGIDPRIGSAYLVWRDENGRLGFGNVDYPSSYKLSVYSNGAYHNIRQSAPLERKSDLSELIEREKSTDEIASSMSKNHLVWRNKDGTLGFGNVDYPKGDNVSHINVNGVWEKKKTQP